MNKDAIKNVEYSIREIDKLSVKIKDFDTFTFLKRFLNSDPYIEKRVKEMMPKKHGRKIGLQEMLEDPNFNNIAYTLWLADTALPSKRIKTWYAINKTYDADGKFIESNNKYSITGEETYTKFMYDNKGRLLKHIELLNNKPSVIINRIYISDDEDEYISNETYYPAIPGIRAMRYSKYDILSDGSYKIIVEIAKNDSSWMPIEVRSYESINNKSVLVKNEYYSDTDFGKIYRTTYDYDTNGNLVYEETIVRSGLSESNSHYSKYEYDNQGRNILAYHSCNDTTNYRIYCNNMLIETNLDTLFVGKFENGEHKQDVFVIFEK